MSKKGFTLIEIMIVVAIILVLVTVAVLAGNSARAGARDNQRLADIKLLQIKLETYRNQNGSYPATLDQLVTSQFMAEIPKDPKKIPYQYAGITFNGSQTCLSYHLGSVLETNRVTNPAPLHKNAGNKCAGSDDDFDATKNPDGSTPSLWYDVSSPDNFQQQL